MSKQASLSIHSENILPIIKKWLYSDKDIFLRELVSNATDAIQKLHVLQGATEGPSEIRISIDRAQRTIRIADTGLGMTAEEVEKYIAQIAFSGAEEFVSKYKDAQGDMIGHFGLGFYSAYMVASKVEIDTLSYLPDAQPVLWSCDGSSTYFLDAGTRQERGTTITLHVEETSLEYLEETKLKELLQRYSSFLPFPIFLNNQPLNNKLPLWLKASSECTEADYLQFYRSLFPTDADPIFWVHINVDYPFHVQGILYFPKMQRRFDGQETHIRLYCNRVFVSDHCKEIFPDYLTVLKGAIDSPDIPLNVSRSYLQVNAEVRQLSAHISKKIADRLTTLYKQERDRFLAAWPDIELFLKLGLLQDDKFYERAHDLLLWKNNRGEWTTVTDYLSRNRERLQSKIYYAAEEQALGLMQLYHDQGIEVLYMNHTIDTAVLQRLESKLSTVQFQRIDGSLEAHLLDPSREKSLLDASGKSQATQIADFVRNALAEKEIDVEAKSLTSDHLHALLLLDEKSRRLRDYFALTQNKPLAGFPEKKTFVVNTNSKLVQSLGKLRESHPTLAKELVEQLYDLSLLSQKEISGKQVEEVAARQTRLLETLVGQLQTL